jgi:UDP-N-acetylmuramate--L-alanine ligase
MNYLSSPTTERDKLLAMTGSLYFIGIAGHAMRGLALATRANGYKVSGLDESAVPPGSDWLDEHSFTWYKTFEPAQLKGVTAVIITGAGATEDTPAVIAARDKHIHIQSFAALFGELTNEAHVVAVAGTHGKTTTTALITWLLESAGKNPDYLVGIQPYNFETSVRLNGSKIAVVEGDEYRASALDSKSKVQYYHPNTLVLTSIEHDHPDMYPDLESVVRRFREVVAQLPKTGHVIACADSKNVLDVVKLAPCAVTTYGLSAGDYQAKDIEYLPTGIEFNVKRAGQDLGRINSGLYGKHNILNILAAVAASIQEGLSFEQIITGAATFLGAYRRFNIVSKPDALITIVDDYAHHPTEVSTNIEAAKLHFKGRRVLVIFRPHTYSRTAALLDEYQLAFRQADVSFITDIEGARETVHTQPISGQDIVDGLKNATYEPNRSDLVEHVVSAAKPGDVILCLSVSGHKEIAHELAALLS